MRCCDSLPPISPRFVSFAWRYHRCVRCSSPPAPDAEPWINRELVGGISSRRARWKRQGLPSSRRNPCDHSPYSSDPGVTRQAEWTMSKLPGAAPATDNDEGSPRGDFGAQSHSVRSGCLRFAGVVTHPPRKTRFRLLVRLYRTGLVTRRVPSERFQASDYPPLPSFLARGQGRFSVFGRWWRIASISPRSIRKPRRARSDRRIRLRTPSGWVSPKAADSSRSLTGVNSRASQAARSRLTAPLRCHKTPARGRGAVPLRRC